MQGGSRKQMNLSSLSLKNKIEVEYTLRDFNKPISVSEYKLTHKIPENIKYKLPSAEEFQNGLL
jgi:hypothetical protein